MKVLIVDDSRMMRKIIRRTLREAGFEHIEVLEASSGVEALLCARQAPPDLILCDWNMPDMSGLEVLQQLKREGCPSPFGFITAEMASGMHSRPLEKGALFLIRKPFKPEFLEQTLSPIIGYV